MSKYVVYVVLTPNQKYKEMRGESIHLSKSDLEKRVMTNDPLNEVFAKSCEQPYFIYFQSR